MSICGNCGTRQERPCTYAQQTREYYDALIAALRHVAYRHGYALALHGSLKSDIDLLAAPWRAGAVSAESLAEALRKTAEIIIGSARIRDVDKDRLPEKKPYGRLAWSFHLTYADGITGPYIDLSVMPRENTESKVAPKREKK